MIYTARCAAMVCQACGLDKKIPRTMRRVLKDSFNNRITERQAVTTRGSLV